MTMALLLLLLIVLARAGETRLFDRGREPGTVYAPWTLALLSVHYFAAAAAACAEHVALHRPFTAAGACAGILLMAARFALKYWSVASLGRYWSSQLELRAGHGLVTCGPYRYLRHPAYLSNLLDLVGVAVLFGAVCTLAWVAVVQPLLILLRIDREERMLCGRFGPAYDAYRRRTWCFIPFVR
jgi:protein-S-isoprenylcysteine O-methyltransferase Ste14